MPTSPNTLLCQYRYDPLDRLIGQTRSGTPVHQRFYCKSRLATEIQGATGRSIVQAGDQLLAQQQRQGDALDTTLSATDMQRSILQTIKPNHPPQPVAYSPYGHHPGESGLSSLLGFNGERRDPVTGCYLLGNGYRAFNPVLMRFNSPDSWSPFGKGGLNPYAYCLGNPINKTDSNGHAGYSISSIVIAKKISRNFRLNKILPNRRQIQTPHFSMNPTERLKASDELLQIYDDFSKIDSHQDRVFNLDYENRKTPNLKNLSAGVVNQFNLRTDGLPVTLQKFAKTPHLPYDSSDLLEVLKSNPAKNMEFDINSLLSNYPLTHSSGRSINPTTINAYRDRINHAVDNVREEVIERHGGLLYRVTGRVYYG
ncbi:RHS repeat-associated core domain-containing protein [Pseudomonas sp. C32]|uniref:RHS repeat-associated core domain-containing protein n=1 Tax=Pseudomonas sp. C32 TaxID=1529208 RepID=UPI002627155D|nr:RHS repeat-associated core domain-containing protein [Pseudomonas sp. C32]MDN4543672.1 RHS repeat-associated core domain-containing protein [Pseudomonas sp. C32]